MAPSPPSTPPIDDRHRAAYRAEGHLVLEQVAPASFLAEVQHALERLVDEQIAEWRREGRLASSHDDQPFETRFHRAWLAAGRPQRDLLAPDPLATRWSVPHQAPDWLAGHVAAVLGTDQVTPDGNSFYRAKFPDDDTTTLPWHQDAQCLESMAHHDAVTAWIPLVDVSVANSCLEVAPVGPGQRLFDPTWSTRAGYICMGDDDVDRLTSTRTVAMRRGDVLLMGARTPHRSLDNTSTSIRWSVDFRYHAV